MSDDSEWLVYWGLGIVLGLCAGIIFFTDAKSHRSTLFPGVDRDTLAIVLDAAIRRGI